MRKLKRSVERNRKSKKIAAIAATTMLATSLMLNGPVQNVHAADIHSDYITMLGATSIPADATVIDISNDAYISNGILDVKITKSGAYKLTGSNIRTTNGTSYIDTRIYVNPNITVDLYIDNLNIFNDDILNDGSSSSGMIEVESISPIIVDGTANVYVMSNSSISAPDEYFYVNGELNFMKSVDGSSLTFYLSKVTSPMLFYIATGNGAVTFHDDSIKLSAFTVGGEQNGPYIFGDFDVNANLFGSSFDFSEKIKFKTVTTDHYQIKSTHGISGKICDIYGNSLYPLAAEHTSGFPKGSDIVQINGNPVSGIVQNSDDHRTYNLYLPSEADIVIKDGENKFWLHSFACVSNPDYPTINASVPAYLVTLCDASDSSEIKHYYSAAGAKVALLGESDTYTYTYTLDSTSGTEITADTTVPEGGMTIYVTKKEKEKVTVSIDGTEYKFASGSTLEENGFNKLYLNAEPKQIVYPTKVLTEPLTLTSVKAPYENTESAGILFTLNDAASVKEFASLVTEYGATDINARLNADVSLDNSFCMIGSLENPFCGSFDGQGHTVTLSLDREDESAVGLFGCISHGAAISNVNTTGSVKGKRSCGGLAGCVIQKNGVQASIVKCTNSASVYSSEYHAGGIVGTFEFGDYQNMDLLIDSCCNTGVIHSDAGFSSIPFGGIMGYTLCATVTNSYNYSDCGIFGYGNGATVTNCYSLGSSDSGYDKTADAFASGEVTYLLNKNANAQIWFQTCGKNLPSLTGDAATQTVYAGYPDCTSDTMIYRNEFIAHTEKGHKDKASAYTYADGNIVAKCEYCDADITAKIVTTAEEKSNMLRGVTVEYSDEWKNSNYPLISIKYSATEDGEYTSEQPTEEGTWFVKAYVGTESPVEVAITDTYTITAKKVNPYTPPAGGGASGGGASGGGVSGDVTGGEASEDTSEEKTEEAEKDISKEKTDEAEKDTQGKEDTGKQEEVAVVASKRTVSTSLESLKELAQSGDASTIAITAEGTKGKTKYTAYIDAEDLDETEFVVYKLDKNGNYVLVNAAKNYATVSEDGKLTVRIAAKGEYKLLSKEAAAKAEAAILKTVTASRKTVTLKANKKTTFKLSKKCNKNNIASITYKASNKNVTVDENGNIIAKKAGKTTVTATVTLKNGTVKKIKMKINI